MSNQHGILNIFGIHLQRLPHQSCFFEIGEKVITGRVMRKGFVVDQLNGDQLIFVDFEGKLFWGVRTPVHDLLPLQFLPVVSSKHMYSLLILYGKRDSLCN